MQKKSKMEKSNLGFFLGAIGFSALISFGFFSAGVTNIQKEIANQAACHASFQRQIDSLETVVNTTFKNQKDTIIVKINPQVVKYYHYSN